MDDVMKQGADRAEFALKTHFLWAHEEMSAEFADEAKTRSEILNAIGLTGAPEDAVCNLMIDLWRFCAREKIDWTGEVLPRVATQIRESGGGENR